MLLLYTTNMAKLIIPKLNFTQIKYWATQYSVWSSAAFFLALAYFLIAMSSMTALTKTEPLTDEIPEQVVEEKPEEIQRDFQLIKDWHLFGSPEVAVVEEEIKQQEIVSQETALPIKLLGVFFLPNQTNNSYAIIEDEIKVQKKYHLGEALPSGVIVQSITKEQVILLRNQQPETLSMLKERAGLLFITK